MKQQNITSQANKAMNVVDDYAHNLNHCVWVYGPGDKEYMFPVATRPAEAIEAEITALKRLGKKLTWLKHKLIEQEQAILATDAHVATGVSGKLSDLTVMVSPELAKIRKMIKDVQASKNLAFDCADELKALTN